MASDTRDDPPVKTTMPSALRAGFISLPRSCVRNATKPMPAPTRPSASVATTAARSQPRGGAAVVSGDFLSGSRLMRCWRASPVAILEGFAAMWSPVWPSIDVIKRGKQRPPGRPGRNRRNRQRLDGQHQVAGRAQRERAEQGCELVADRRAGEPARDRFREAKSEHGGAAADQAALETEAEEVA